MRMRHHRHHNGPSLFSSLGQAFNFHHSPRYDVSTVQPDPRVFKYEQFLSESVAQLSDSYKGVPSLKWIHQAVLLVNSAVSEAQVFIPAVNYPLSEFDEAWVTKYLEETCRFLDVLNTVRKAVAEIEHRHMLLKLAVHTMGVRGVPEECKRTKVKKYLGEYSPCLEKERCVVSKLENCVRVLQDMCLEGATDKRNFLCALYGAKVVSASVLVIVTSVLSRNCCLKSVWEDPKLAKGISGDRGDLDEKSVTVTVTVPVSEETSTALEEKPEEKKLEVNGELKEWHIPEGYAWSKPLRDLVNKLRESPLVIEEFKALESGLRSLDTKLEEAAVEEVKKLEAVLKSVEEGVDLVKQEMDRLFRVIVSNRNSLLCYLRLKSEEGCGQ